MSDLGGIFEQGGEGSSKKGGRMSLADRKAALADMDVSDLSAVAARAAVDNHASGHISEDAASRYLIRIAKLFPGASTQELDVAMTVWGIYNGVGSRTDYSTAPDVVVGGHSVRATKIFGEILPVTREGIPRKFYKTVYGANAGRIARSRPELVAFLEARLAEVGMPGADITAAIDFYDGVTPGTTGGGTARAAVKSAKIKKRGGDQTEVNIQRQLSSVPVGEVSNVEELY